MKLLCAVLSLSFLGFSTFAVDNSGSVINHSENSKSKDQTYAGKATPDDQNYDPNSGYCSEHDINKHTDDGSTYGGGHTTPPPSTPQQTIYDWGTGNNGWGYCYEWSADGYILNNGNPVANSNCEANHPSYYNWDAGLNGWGYCYQFTTYDVPMNDGRAQKNANCEKSNPSYYDWGSGKNGRTYCYQFAPSGLVLNEGDPVHDHYCRN